MNNNKRPDDVTKSLSVKEVLYESIYGDIKRPDDIIFRTPPPQDIDDCYVGLTPVRYTSQDADNNNDPDPDPALRVLAIIVFALAVGFVAFVAWGTSL